MSTQASLHTTDPQDVHHTFKSVLAILARATRQEKETEKIQIAKE